jgi:hypothetical protein
MQTGMCACSLHVRRLVLGMVAAVCLVAGLPAAAPGQADRGTPGLPEVVRTRHRTFAIPFRVPKSQDPAAEAAPQRIVLDVSKDLGGTWQSAGEAAPAKGSFTYTADVDGEYWFRVRAVDRQGRMRGGEGPDMRVLVDAAGPRLAARVWKGADGEIICRYAATDDSLRLEAFKLEYRGPGDQGWKTVATQPILSRESPAHAVGEEIWWVGEKVASLTVRIVVADGAGNQTVRQFTLEQADPQVDQAALAQELGVPPLPAAGPETAAQVVATQPPEAAPASGFAGTAGWTAESARAWSDGRPRDPDLSAADRGRSVLVKPAASAAALLPRGDSSAAAAGDERGDSLAAAIASRSLEYRGKPLHLAKSRRFSWDYEPQEPIPGVGRLRAELWTTRDGGVTWQRSAVDADGRSPIDVQLAATGLYGVRLEMVADVPDAGDGPRSGDAPEAWLGIDDEPPQVDLLDVTRDPQASGVLVIRYTARDPLLGPAGCRLLYSPNAEGPWATIADGLAAQGEHRWQPDRAVPARVHVRVEVADAAGNVGTASSSEAITVAAPRVVGKLGGLRPASDR